MQEVSGKAYPPPAHNYSYAADWAAIIKKSKFIESLQKHEQESDIYDSMGNENYSQISLQCHSLGTEVKWHSNKVY